MKLHDHVKEMDYLIYGFLLTWSRLFLQIPFHLLDLLISLLSQSSVTEVV